MMSPKLLGILVCLSLVLCSAPVNLPAQASDIAASGGAVSSRLPNTAIPTRYRLRIEPDLSSFTFKGEETVSLEISKRTQDIILNAAELKLTAASLISAGAGAGEKLSLPGAISLSPALEQAQISFAKPLMRGSYDLKISFTGILNDKLRGFYRSFYVDDKGAKHTLATTQMEPTDARRMFPCFDEPSYKAAFQVTTVIDPKLVAISNAPVTSEKIDPSAKKKVVVFAESPKMSTYLVTLIVGNFESSPASNVSGVPVRVWAVQGKAKLGEYARKMASRLLPYYISYFGVPYPAKKLDLIAIPDFEAGAMENLGAITFRENNLLVDEEKTSTETLQEVASVVAHEMAHLWFGDLVTMKWWDDLWLNEAFATWMSTKAIDHLMPEWHFWDNFGLSRAQALQTDSLKATRPIHFTVDNPNQINEMFDDITYEKGASVLRMLEQYVGEQVFQSGVQQYISRHKFANATTEELWQAVGEASHQPVPEMMHGWVFQPGYPLISTEPSSDGKAINLSQKRFLLDATAGGASIDQTLWHVPVGLRELAGSAKRSNLFLKAAGTTASSPASGHPFIANAGADGFYRVHYPAPMLKEISPLVQSNLSSAERLSVLTDQWSLALAGLIPADEYLALTASYKTETDPSVAKSLIGQLGQLSSLTDESARPNFERFVQDRLGPIKEALGWTTRPNESALIHILRGNVLQTLGTIGQDKSTIEEACRLFAKSLEKPDSVDPDLLDAITDIVAYNGGDNEFAQVKKLWKEAKTPEIELRNLLDLASFRKPELTKQALDLCLSDEVRTQDKPRLLSALLREDASKSTAWQFIKDNWSEVLKQYPLNMVPRVVSAASSFSTTQQEEDLRAFFSSHPVPAGEHAVARMLERVHVYTAFRNRSGQSVGKWLEKI